MQRFHRTLISFILQILQRFDIQNDKDVLIEIMLFSLCFPIISKILYKSESTELLNSFDGKYSVFHIFIFYFLHFHKKTRRIV